jgi:tetratricopeptide (TPR) repeat protein
MNRIFTLLFSLLIFSSASFADDAENREAKKSADQADAKIEKFLSTSCQDEVYDAAAREKAIETVSNLRADEFGKDYAIVGGLRELSATFNDALLAIDRDETAEAITLLKGLETADDSFLAANATFYRARLLAFQDNFEQAMPLITKLAAEDEEYLLQNSEVAFLHAVGHAAMLSRDKAIAAFEKFLEDYPDAPRRMQLGAMRQLGQLKAVEDGSLADVMQRMEFAGRRLSLEDPGKQTQEEQDKVVAMLDKLIEEAEERECKACQGSGSGSGNKPASGSGSGSGKPGEGQGDGPAGGNDQTPFDTVRRTFQKGPESPWGKIRDKERDPAFQAIKAKFPARYQEMIDQYYKSFQDQE